MIKSLIFLHVTAGVFAFVGMIGALSTQKGGLWHRRSGTLYTYAMAISLGLAFIVSLLTLNAFLLLIGLFSAYFVYTGWRLAVTKDGTRNQLDKLCAQFMIACSALMLAYALFMLFRGNNLAIALVVFSVLAFLPAWQDFRKSDGWPTGKARIAEHLNRMGGASIATVTAAFVTNVQTNPAFIAWLLPGIIGGPLIVYWTRRTLAPASKRV